MNARVNTVLLKSIDAQKDLRRFKNPSKAKLLARYFKTGPGEYGQGDQFLGLTVPQTRSVANKWKSLPLSELSQIVCSPWHEERMLAFMILKLQFELACKIERKNQKEAALRKAKIFQFLWKHRRFANNWDLIDGIFPAIMGCYFFENPQTMKAFWPKLYESSDLWEQRMAILTTFYFVSKKEFKPSIFVGKYFLKSKRDLIHKASGWMLREIGKRDLQILLDFLNTHADRMPRTMLRYSIERLPVQKRKYYLNYSSTPTS